MEVGHTIYISGELTTQRLRVTGAAWDSLYDVNVGEGGRHNLLAGAVDMYRAEYVRKAAEGGGSSMNVHGSRSTTLHVRLLRLFPVKPWGWRKVAYHRNCPASIEPS